MSSEKIARRLLVGLVFDLSQGFTGSGAKRIDAVKDALVSLLVRNPGLCVYVSHPATLRPPRDEGESTFGLITYKEPDTFSVDGCFRRAIGVVGDCPEDRDKCVILVTDRFAAPVNFRYRKGFLMNAVRGYPIAFLVVGLGPEYDRRTLESIAAEYEADFIHVPDDAEVSGPLTEYLEGQI